MTTEPIRHPNFFNPLSAKNPASDGVGSRKGGGVPEASVHDEKDVHLPIGRFRKFFFSADGTTF